MKINNSDEVYVYKTTQDPDSMRQSVDDILKSIKFKDPFSVINIKPNLCYYWKSSTGYTTDPRLVSTIIDSVREQYGDEIEINVVEADASGMRTKYVFPMLDYTKLSKEKNVNLINLSKVESVRKELTINGHKIKLKLPKMLVQDNNILINVPKFKLMKETHITCALKNIFGCIATPRKIVYHKYLNETIVAVNKFIQTDAVIVDGLVALENKPFNLNMVMGGKNAFSVDYIVSKIVGYNPNSVGHIKLAQNEGLGDPKRIKIIGDPIDQFKFPKINNTISKHSFKILLRLLRIYSKIVGDVIPPMFETI